MHPVFFLQFCPLKGKMHAATENGRRHRGKWFVREIFKGDTEKRAKLARYSTRIICLLLQKGLE